MVASIPQRHWRPGLPHNAFPGGASASASRNNWPPIIRVSPSTTSGTPVKSSAAACDPNKKVVPRTASQHPRARIIMTTFRHCCVIAQSTPSDGPNLVLNPSPGSVYTSGRNN